MRGGDVVILLCVCLHLVIAELAALLAVDLGEQIGVQIVEAAALSVVVLGVAVGGKERLKLSVGIVVRGDVLILYILDLIVNGRGLLVGERNAHFFGLLLNNAVSCYLLSCTLEAPLKVRHGVVKKELAVPVNACSGIALIEILKLADRLIESSHVLVKAHGGAVDGHHGVLLSIAAAARRAAAEHHKRKCQCDKSFHVISPVVKMQSHYSIKILNNLRFFVN